MQKIRTTLIVLTVILLFGATASADQAFSINATCGTYQPPLGYTTKMYTLYRGVPDAQLYLAGCKPATMTHEGVTHRFTYNENGFIKTVEDSDGIKSELTYNSQGLFMERRSSCPGDPTKFEIIAYQYDASGRLAGHTFVRPEGCSAQEAYEFECKHQYPAANQEFHTGGGYDHKFEYDNQGRLVRETYEGGGTGTTVEEYSYEGNRLVTMRKSGMSPMNQGTNTYRYDSDGRLTAIATEEPGAPGDTRISYDDQGRITKVELQYVQWFGMPQETKVYEFSY